MTTRNPTIQFNALTPRRAAWAQRRLGTVALVAVLAMARATHAGDAEIYCWQAWLYDHDHDGYASSRHAPTKFTVSNNKKLYCPSGWVKYNTDCDDRNASVHPNRDEVAFNGVDDNCSGRPDYEVGTDQGEVNRRAAVDETQFTYGTWGDANTQTSFATTAVVKDAQILQHHANLYAGVELADLSRSAAAVRLPIYRVTDLTPAGGVTRIGISGLTPESVYRARVRFYRGGQAAPLPGPIPLGLLRVRAEPATPTSYVQVGGESDWYYTTTKGDTPRSHARTTMLLHAFKEFDESNNGRVGYLGTVKRDGTRYGASKKERWCSEFYAWSAREVLRSIGTLDSVADLLRYYRVFDQYRDADEIPTVGRRGDYVPMHDETHSAMFLAWDPTINRVWTIEGNWQNRVRIMQRTLSEFDGLGHINDSMLSVNW